MQTDSTRAIEKLLVTPEQVAEMLGVGRSTVYDLMRTKELASVKIGRARRVPIATVRDYVDRLASIGSSA